MPHSTDPRLTSAELARLNERLVKQSPQQIVSAGLALFPSRPVIASSFSQEDCVVIDIAWRVSRRFRVVTLDTGRLPEETHAVIDDVRRVYGSEVEVFYPQTNAVEALVRIKGTHSFRNSVPDRQECCRVRKVEPLARALAGVDTWITGLRRAQSVTRGELLPAELDGDGRVKLNPLWSFTDEALADYVKTHGVPVNALHARGYPSIGCAPCTRAVAPGEDVRAGRWWWEEPAHKECGLHPAHAAVVGARSREVRHG